MQAPLQLLWGLQNGTRLFGWSLHTLVRRPIASCKANPGPALPYQCDEQHHSRFLNQGVPHLLALFPCLRSANYQSMHERLSLLLSLPPLRSFAYQSTAVAKRTVWTQALAIASPSPRLVHSVCSLASRVRYCTTCYLPVEDTGGLPISTNHYTVLTTWSLGACHIYPLPSPPLRCNAAQGKPFSSTRTAAAISRT